MESRTIAACSTGSSPSGVGIIRVSGERSKTVLRNFFESKLDPISRPRQLCFGKFIANDEILDHCLAVFFKGPDSYTGEDIIEFHVHGSPILIQNILNEIFKFGVTPALPGEFTQTAFLNGKIDLVQAESVGEIIHATNARALKLAQENLKGKLSVILDSITEPLRDSLAEIEANIDFVDEDILPDTLDKIYNQVIKTRTELKKLLKSFSAAQHIKEGIRIQIFGKPNTGKSSLLNRILNRERAIVSNIPGTTRDLIEEQIIIDDLQFVFIDSAGVRETNDHVENLGVKLALDYAKYVDLVLIILDQDTTENEIKELIAKVPNVTYWLIKNKSDLERDFLTNKSDYLISVKDNAGIDTLINGLVEFGKSKTAISESGFITNARQKQYLESAYGFSLDINKEDSLELLSLKIRSTLTAIDEIVGKTQTEDILGRIFSKFCVGK